MPQPILETEFFHDDRPVYIPMRWLCFSCMLLHTATWPFMMKTRILSKCHHRRLVFFWFWWHCGVPNWLLFPSSVYSTTQLIHLDSKHWTRRERYTLTESQEYNTSTGTETKLCLIAVSNHTLISLFTNVYTGLRVCVCMCMCVYVAHVKDYLSLFLYTFCYIAASVLYIYLWLLKV